MGNQEIPKMSTGERLICVAAALGGLAGFLYDELIWQHRHDVAAEYKPAQYVEVEATVPPDIDLYPSITIEG